MPTTNLRLHHLTLNTGHIAVTPRSAVGNDVIEYIAPLIADWRNHPAQIPTPGLDAGRGHFLRVTFSHPETEGGPVYSGVFSVFGGIAVPGGYRRGAPLISGVVCWHPDAEGDEAMLAWNSAVTAFRQVTQEHRRIVPPSWLRVATREKPPFPPWLAVWLYPTLSFDLDAAKWLGDLERCIAWGMIEACGGIPS